MCGIAGCWTPAKAFAEASVKAMLAAQTHRGPDDEGLVALPLDRGSMVFGHRRLSIQDLSPAGHQPMENPETGDWIVFNGEIYNYPELRNELEGAGSRFRSRCDTEVILHAFARWGTEAFNRLHGMFALGLFDKRRQRLVLARDPLGIKPLYYAFGRDALVFASELRAVEAGGAIEAAIDPRAWAGALAYGNVPAPLTMLQGVQSFDAGCWAGIDLRATFQPAELQPVRYWEFPSPDRAPRETSQIEEQIGERLQAAVRSHLISDVPVGVFLSSGLDSTAVAALCAEARDGDMDTFTVSFADDPELDENPYAERTAKALGARHHCIRLSEPEVRHLAQRWLDSLDQPSVDGINTYIISHAVRQRGIIVALSGLGGDEVFCGYPSFRDVPRVLRLARASQWIPRKVRQSVAGWMWRNKTKAQRRKAMEFAGDQPDLPALYFRRRRLLSDAEMAGLGIRRENLDLDEAFLPAECEPSRGLSGQDPIGAVGVLESRFYMGNMLLRDTDVFSMAHGLEIRVPMLDRQLIDLAYAVPGRQRLSRRGVNKSLLVNSMGNRIPSELHALKKRGFCLPVARWMAGPLRPLFEDFIQTMKLSGLVNPQGVSAVWDDFLKDQSGQAWSRAWMIGVLGSWLKRRSK